MPSRAARPAETGRSTPVTGITVACNSIKAPGSATAGCGMRPRADLATREEQIAVAEVTRAAPGVGRLAGVQRKSWCPLTIRLLGRTEIRRLAKELEFRPRKSLGQNFVHDANTVRRIVSASGIGRADHVLEVGPGLGSLTLALLDRGATRHRRRDRPGAGRAAAADRRRALAQRNPAADGAQPRRLDASARRSGLNGRAHRGRRQPALQHRGPGAAASACRISVDPGRDGDGAGRGRRAARRRAGRQGIRRAQRQGALLRTGSPLRHGVADGVLADSPRLLRAGSHRPVRRRRRGQTDDAFRRQVFELIDIAFAQRRKTSRNAFLEWAGSGNESANRLLAASIDPARRGETLSIEDFVRLLRRSGDPATTASFR